MYKALPEINKSPFLMPILFGGLFIALGFIWWPGMLRPDSLNQLAQAQVGIFSGDHHPPIMSFYWYYLNRIYPGSGLMFLSYLGLLVGSVFLLSRTIQKKWTVYYLLILFFPPLLKYTGTILKDMGFSSCYLFCLTVFTWHILKKKEMSLVVTIAVFILLFYGTAVKYQAIFLLPFMSYWLGFIKNNFQLSKKTFLYSCLIYSLLYGAVTIFNTYSIQQKDHAWQYVKLYDLAAISLTTEKNLFPESAIKSSFSLKKLAEKYNTWRVDDLVFGPDAILQKGRNDLERDQIWKSWFQAVINHPMNYFQHRLNLSKNLWNLSSVKSLKDIKTDYSSMPKIVYYLLKGAEFLKIMDFLKILTIFSFYLPLMILYAFFGLCFYLRNHSLHAFTLMMLNTTGLILVTVLFFFSMASDDRYIYFTVCCLHLSHPFAFLTYQDYKTAKKYREMLI